MNFARSSCYLPSEGLDLFRRGIGLLCLADAVLRLPTATFYLSDLGMFPRNLYFVFFEDSLLWSVFLISGQPLVAVLLLFVVATLGLLHCAGKGGRWSRACLWVLLVSMHNRNPGILDSSDDLLRLMAFWDIFLPETGSTTERRNYFRPATLGWQIQLTLVCLFTVFSLSGAQDLALQWKGDGWTPALPIFSLIQVALVLVVLALWFAPIRMAALFFVLPVLAAWAVVLHPSAPATFAVALLSLVRRSDSERQQADVRAGKGVWSLVLLCSFLILGLNLVEGSLWRRPLVGLARITGFTQNWTRFYPLQEKQLAELVAREPRSGQVVWTVSSEGGRRDRLLAQRVQENAQWGAYISGAVARELELEKSPTLWMRVEDLRADYGLGGTEVVLLSDTPVRLDTRRRWIP